uniref:Indolepyruvate ferredoxin oxidoreductase n=1 Tax=Ignisphaera aggregans TaxID=334771 RepID=A0A7J2U392_9CREN
MPSQGIFKDKVNIVIVGVGGQGLITFGRVLGEACIRRGIDIRIAETHGMSQRGGAVEVFVRIGYGVRAPLVSPGQADYVVATEVLEALRGVRYLKKCGWILISDIILPPPLAKNVPLPEDIITALKKLPINVIQVPADAIVRKVGDVRTMNMAMLGGLVAFIESLLPVEVVAEVIENMLGYINKEAFLMGYEEVKNKKSDNTSTNNKICLDK